MALHVVLYIVSDNVMIGSKAYKQRSGLAMGNNLAPVLAVIYMNELDDQILAKSNGCATLKRYTDDYFAFLISKEFTAVRLLETASSLNNAIQFTLELPKDNQLPFLDTLVTFNPQEKTFSTTLYIKPIHSRCITPWDSHGSVASKRAVLIGEIKRAVRCSTDCATQKQSLKLITQLFVHNGYPTKFVKGVIRSTLSDRHQRDDQQEHIYLKLPFINEEYKRRALGVLNR